MPDDGGNQEVEQEVEKVRLLLEEARWRRDDQIARQDALNRRLSTLFALNFAVLAVLGASLRFGDLVVPRFLEYTVYAAVFVLVANVVVLLWAYRVGRGSRRPDLERLMELTNSDHSTAVLVQWTASEIRLALQANEELLSDKGRRITWAMRISLVAVLLVALVISLALRFGDA